MNAKNNVSVALIALFIGVSSTYVLAEADAHGDISPRVANWQLVTDAYIDAVAQRVQNVRVFGFDFGEDPADPFFIGDPGFNALAGSGLSGSGLPSGLRVGFQLVSNLSYWNGEGPVNFAPAPADAGLALRFGSPANDRNATGDQHDAAARFFGPVVADDGSFHEHLASMLGGAAPPRGIYRADLQLLLDTDADATNGVTLASPDLYLVYNNDVDEPVHAQAIEFIRDNLAPDSNLVSEVPEPGAMPLLLLGASLLFRFRR